MHEFPTQHSATRVSVPGREEAVLTVGRRRLTGILRKLSMADGTIGLSKPFPPGTTADILIQTTAGPVRGVVYFEAWGAEGVLNVQAFRFIHMDGVDRTRLESVLRQMLRQGLGERRHTKPRTVPRRNATLQRSLSRFTVSVRCQEQIGSVVSGAGLVWASYVGTSSMRIEALANTPGDVELCGLGVLIWLIAKWRRAAVSGRQSRLHARGRTSRPMDCSASHLPNLSSKPVTASETIATATSTVDVTTERDGPIIEEISGRGEIQAGGKSYRVAYSFTADPDSGNAGTAPLPPAKALFRGRIRAESKAALIELAFAQEHELVLCLQDRRRAVIQLELDGRASVTRIL